MATFPLISLNDAVNALARRPGIVIGSDATCVPGTVRAVISQSFNRSGIPSELSSSVTEETYSALLDQLASSMPEKATLIAHEIKEGLRTVKPGLDLPYLAKAGWSACISLTQDVLFESALRNYLDSIPSSRTATIVDNVRVDVPERTIPVYKLFGNLNNGDSDSTLALSASNLLLRQQIWPRLLRTCADYVREAPLFFVGTSLDIPAVRLVLSTLLGMRKPSVTKLLFLKDDTTLSDSTVQALCSQYRTNRIDASLRELCTALGEMRETASSGRVETDQAETSIARVLSRHDSLVVTVPTTPTVPLDVSRDRQALIDGLFRPMSIDWNPFLINMDLRRTITDTFKDEIKQLAIRQGHRAEYIVSHGDAAIGKTTLLKRVAVELAKEGFTSLWCRRVQSENWVRQYRKLALELGEAVKKESKQDAAFVIFCDDPWTLRLDAGEMMACFDTFPGRIVFVFAVRNTAYFTTDGAAVSIRGLRNPEISIPYELDGKEVNGLAALLCRIGAFTDDAAAQSEIKRVPSRNSSDILCSLWYLVPETRSQLTDSLRDEYCRLGDVRESIAQAAQQIAMTSAIAHKAYEYVTVTSHLDIGLPIEVLVRALGIDYAEWLDTSANGRPLWGLLYDEQDNERNTILYRTRNEVVTNALLNLVNGGVGHQGEARVLRELLSACDVGGASYRGFVIDVLVRGRKKLA
ncbi:MAG: hypothetical protein ABI728_06000, partial [Betaproteobacteria bacterium]